MHTGLRNRAAGSYGVVMTTRVLSSLMFVLVGCSPQIGEDGKTDTAGDTAGDTDTASDTDTDTGDTGKDTGGAEEPVCVGDWAGTVTLTAENDRGEFELCTGEVELTIEAKNLTLTGTGTCEGEGGGDPDRPAPSFKLELDGKADESCELGADIALVVVELGESMAEDRWEGSADATDGTLDVVGEITTPPGPDGAVVTVPYAGSIVLAR